MTPEGAILAFVVAIVAFLVGFACGAIYMALKAFQKK